METFFFSYTYHYIKIDDWTNLKMKNDKNSIIFFGQTSEKKKKQNKTFTFHEHRLVIIRKKIGPSLDTWRI